MNSINIVKPVLSACAFSLVLSVSPGLAQDVPTAPEASPEVYKIIGENDQWRVIEATWQPGQEDEFHSHPPDRVSLIRTDCHLQFTMPDGSTREAKPAAGRVVVRTGKPKGPIELIIRQQRGGENGCVPDVPGCDGGQGVLPQTECPNGDHNHHSEVEGHQAAGSPVL